MKTLGSKSKSGKPFGLIYQLVNLILILWLTGCNFPGVAKPANQLNNDLPEEFIPPSVNFQYRLHLANPIQIGEKIVLEILDEVTGLANNIQTIDLEEINDLEYSASLAFPTGSVIKYRYARISDSKTVETQPDGAPVRYRLSYFRSSMQVIDFINGWFGEENSFETGTFVGTILDRDSQIPLPDVLVSAGGQLTFTDANGAFKIDDLQSGVHNVVFFSMDGSYQTHQQLAEISPNKKTRADINLQLALPVRVTFNITPPGEAVGAPIYIAGNYFQLGNTFTDLTGSMSIHPKKMPALEPKQDGSLTIELQLYAGMDLRYKFTLGDGYWNAEQKASGEPRSRQLIVPKEDITLNQTIETWRSPETGSVTFQVSIPPESSPEDEKSIQFKSLHWTEPIPLWPIGDGNYLYILYSPLDVLSSLSYRFCRNNDCQKAQNVTPGGQGYKLEFTIEDQIISHTIEDWENWQTLQIDTTPISIPIPTNYEYYSTIFELSPEMNPNWEAFAPLGLSTIAGSGVKTVIFSPQWTTNLSNGNLQPVFGITPYHQELINLLANSRAFGLKHGIFPQIEMEDSLSICWQTFRDRGSDWDFWSQEYRRFILNYANIAESSQSECLLLGGRTILPTFTGGFYPDGTPSDVPETNESVWLELIADLREIYHGEIWWAANASQTMDPLPEFIHKFDGIYIMIDTPLAANPSPSTEEIALNFTYLIDNHIYEVYRSTMKPIILAFAYPSVEGAAQGCNLVTRGCFEDGLLLPEEIEGLTTDQQEQALIYATVLPIVASRDWIRGTSIRGFEPAVSTQEGSTSIGSKLAMSLISEWYLHIIGP